MEICNYVNILSTSTYLLRLLIACYESIYTYVIPAFITDYMIIVLSASIAQKKTKTPV